MANANPYLILRRVRDATILELREIFAPRHNTAVVPPFEYNYIETSASGSLQFYGNPANNDTFTIGINVITFVTGTPSGLQVRIGMSQQVTLSNLVALINANSTTLLVTATTNSIPGKVNIQALAQGASGNSITLSTTSLVLKVSAPTLTQGGLFDFDNSEIFIADAIPQDYQNWPCLIVDTAMASETRYLGPEDAFQTKNQFGVVTQDEIFSSLMVTVNIKLYTIDDTLARDNIIDLIYNNTSEIRHQWASHGIEMIDRSLQPENRIFQDQRQYVTNHLAFRVYCEWSDDTPITNVTSISVSVPVTVDAIPVINSPISVSNIPAATDFNYTVTATNNPTSYGATGLPVWASIDTSNGLISGTPATSGTFYITVSATNSTGTGTGPLTLTIS